MTQEQENQFAITKTADTRIQETAATSRAAAATALVQARCVMALQRPRDWDTVRAKLLKECQRPGFAKAAVYRKPMGGRDKQEGSSIRFAEAAMRYAGNIDVQSEVVHEDEVSITVQVTALDLETNAGGGTAVRIQKTVERSSPRGRTVLSRRENSKGEAVFIVVATEDEMIGKTNSLVSKARRNLILQMIPGDIVEECKAECQRVFADKAAKDPKAAYLSMLDDFAELGVLPSQIKEYLGHGNQPNPKELEDLRGIYAAISSNETTWSAVTEDLRSEAEEKRDAVLDSLKNSKPVTVPAPQTAPRKPPYAPENELPLQRGDVEDALQRIRKCPDDELRHLADELTCFAWLDTENARLKAAFSARRKPQRPAPAAEPDPDSDGR